jgi:hypothetical protein
MSRLDAATGRFNAALETLAQSASTQTLARDSLDDTALRLAAVTEERDRLRARIRELEEEARVLGGVTHDVEGRLDGAIAEIRAALGR